MTNDSEQVDSRSTRSLDKREATRHLLHAAIRLIMKKEDPFAIHLLIHSADKLLIDVAKAQNKLLRTYWEDYIKPEFHKPFFEKHRAIYNYFKHADEDSTDELPIHDIAMLNIMTLLVCLGNYASLYRETTHHMLLFMIFAMNVQPGLIVPDAPLGADLVKNVRTTQYMTPSSFFQTFKENSHVLPNFYKETSDDLIDVHEFYNLTFAELRAGKRKRTNVFRLPGA